MQCMTLLMRQQADCPCPWKLRQHMCTRHTAHLQMVPLTACW